MTKDDEGGGGAAEDDVIFFEHKITLITKKNCLSLEQTLVDEHQSYQRSPNEQTPHPNSTYLQFQHFVLFYYTIVILEILSINFLNSFQNTFFLDI